MHKNDSNGKFSLNLDPDCSHHTETRDQRKGTYKDHPDVTEDATPPKDLKVLSYSGSFSKSDSESLEFIHRAQYDFDKLMEHSNGEWRRDSDIIRESLGYYQQKSRAAESVKAAAENDMTTATRKQDTQAQAQIRFVIDEFEEDNYKTSSKITNTNNSRTDGFTHGMPSARDHGMAPVLIPEDHIPNRHSMRIDPMSFSKKPAQMANPRKVIPTKPSNIGSDFKNLKKSFQAVLQAKENQKKANLSAQVGNFSSHVSGSFGLPNRRQTSMNLGHVFSRFGSRHMLFHPPQSQKKRQQGEPLEKISHELGIRSNSSLTDILSAIRNLKQRVRHMETHASQKGGPGDLPVIKIEEHDTEPAVGSTLIDLYNPHKSRGDVSSAQTYSGYSHVSFRPLDRKSFSASDWKLGRPFEGSFSLRRGNMLESSGLAQHNGKPGEKPKIFGKLSKLVNAPRLQSASASRRTQI